MTLVLCMICSQTFAQFYNNGATVTIQSGGLIFVQGDAQINSGTLTNDGKIEVLNSQGCWNP